jgi:hypothetical protein
LTRNKGAHFVLWNLVEDLLHDLNVLKR